MEKYYCIEKCHFKNKIYKPGDEYLAKTKEEKVPKEYFSQAKPVSKKESASTLRKKALEAVGHGKKEK